MRAVLSTELLTGVVADRKFSYAAIHFTTAGNINLQVQRLRMDSSFTFDSLESTLTELENNFLQEQQHLQERMYCIYYCYYI